MQEGDQFQAVVSERATLLMTPAYKINLYTIVTVEMMIMMMVDGNGSNSSLECAMVGCKL